MCRCPSSTLWSATSCWLPRTLTCGSSCSKYRSRLGPGHLRSRGLQSSSAVPPLPGLAAASHNYLIILAKEENKQNTEKVCMRVQWGPRLWLTFLPFSFHLLQAARGWADHSGNSTLGSSGTGGEEGKKPTILIPAPILSSRWHGGSLARLGPWLTSDSIFDCN